MTDDTVMLLSSMLKICSIQYNTVHCYEILENPGQACSYVKYRILPSSSLEQGGFFSATQRIKVKRGP